MTCWRAALLLGLFCLTLYAGKPGDAKGEFDWKRLDSAVALAMNPSTYARALPLLQPIADDQDAPKAARAKALYHLIRLQLLAGDGTAAQKSMTRLTELAGSDMQTLLANAEGVDAAQIARINQMLADIRIPRVDLQACSLTTCIRFLTDRSRELDIAGRGVNMNFFWSPDASKASADKDTTPDGAAMQLPTMTLSLRNVTLGAALADVCRRAGVTYTVTPSGVAIWIPRKK